MNARLHPGDVLLDVAVGREDIGIAVKIVIEEEEPEGDAEQGGASEHIQVVPEMCVDWRLQIKFV